MTDPRDPILLGDWYFEIEEESGRVFSTRTGRFVTKRDQEFAAWCEHSEPAVIASKEALYRRLLSMPVHAERLREALGVAAPQAASPADKLAAFLRENPDVHKLVTGEEA